MFDVYGDLRALYREHAVETTATYDAVAGRALGRQLACATPAMHGLCSTLFSSDTMIAYNLLQNSVDEAKGAARICVIADRYAPPELAGKMKRHVREEMKHSAQFLHLIVTTGVGKAERGDGGNVGPEVAKIFDFDDELRRFICRVHSIEIRSWTILRTYIQVLEATGRPELLSAVPVIEEIMADEINHVFYTGEQINAWLREDPALAEVLADCFAHTNRETWHDMASMSNYLADNSSAILAA